MRDGVIAGDEWVSQDGARLLFTYGAGGIGPAPGIYSSEKTGSAWSTPVLASTVGFPFIVGDENPHLTLDEQTLFWESSRPGGYGQQDLWLSHKSGGTWGAPENLGQPINTPGIEGSPFSLDGVELLYDDKGATGIFRTLLGNGGVWSAPVRIIAFAYDPAHRALQGRYDTRRIADTLAGLIVHDELTESDSGFITSRDMFWLASVDQTGAPTVSYKGGAPGFVQTPDSRTLVFPCYDGNGMFYSMGNLAIHPQVGLLFMDFEKPHRLRVQGSATIDSSPALVASFPGALFAVRVAVSAIFQNCPRYVHRHASVAASRYVPALDGSAPLAGWKRIDFLQSALPHYDQGRAAVEGGSLTIEAWMGKVISGDPEA